MRELLYRSTNPEGKTQDAFGSSDSFLQTLLPYIGEDLEILKLHVASHISNCTAAGHKAGLPLHVAEALNLERTSLSRQFHREIGRTLTEYIHGAKMEEAEKTDCQPSVFSRRNC